MGEDCRFDAWTPTQEGFPGNDNGTRCRAQHLPTHVFWLNLNFVGTIFNIAKEPEIDDLISLLKKMGAPIHRQQPDVVTIKGSRKLTSCEHTIIGDRLEAGTYLIAAAATQGNITTN